MAREIKAGAVYFAAVFCVGFALGAIRVLAVAPHLGRTLGVLLETPLILAASWAICRICVDHFAVAREFRPRALMGATAFFLLMCAEWSVSKFLFGQTTAAQVSAYGSIPGAIGLAAQIVFGFFPLLQGFARGSD